LSEEKVVSRNIAVAAGIVAILLLIGLVGSAAYYTSIIKDKDSIIEDMKQQITSLNSQISDLEATVEDRDQQIAELNQRISDLEAATKDRDYQILNLEMQVSSLESELSEREEQISSLKEEINSLSEADVHIVYWWWYDYPSTQGESQADVYVVLFNAGVEKAENVVLNATLYDKYGNTLAYREFFVGSINGKSECYVEWSVYYNGNAETCGIKCIWEVDSG